MSGNRICFMGRGSRRSQGQTHAAISTVKSRHFHLLHRGAVLQGLPASLKYNNKVSGSETLQKSQGLVPDSISRSVGPCRSSQSDPDMEKNPFYLQLHFAQPGCIHCPGAQKQGATLKVIVMESSQAWWVWNEIPCCFKSRYRRGKMFQSKALENPY